MASSGAGAVSRSTTSRPTPKGGSSAAAKASEKRSTGPKKIMPHPPEVPGVARIIAIANQKGGVGKSTTAVSLGASLADLGYQVLVIDLDPQGNASTGMGIRHDARDVTVYDVVVSEAAVSEAIVQTPVPRLFALPSTIDLAGAEIELVSQFSRETRLKKALEPVREGTYDFILLDCPPSLGLLTINALTAAEELIVPIQCEYYALEGLGQLLRNVSLVQQNINPDLKLSGIVMTMFDPRTKLSEQVVQEVRNYFGALVYDIIIPRTVRLSEAPGFGQPITVYDPKSKGAESYRELAREVALRPAPDEPMPIYENLPTIVVPPIDASDVPEPDVPEPDAVEDAVEAAPPVAAEEPPSLPEAHEEPTAEDPPLIEPPWTTDDPPTADLSVPEEAADAQAPAEHVFDVALDIDLDGDDDMWEDAEEAPGPASRVSPPTSPAPPGHLPERRVVVIDEDAGYPVSSERTPTGPPAAPIDEPAPPAVADIGARLENDGAPPKRRWRLFRKGGE
jgi:chromosome partitioning protein